MYEEDLLIIDEQPEHNLNVSFFPVINDNGDKVDFVKVEIPGNTQTIVIEEATDNYKTYFKKEWAIYNGAKHATGISIDEWHEIPQAMREEFKKQGFNYVNQVAVSPDSSFGNIMNQHMWQAKARAFIERNKVTPEKVINAQQAEINDLRDQLAELQAMLKPKRGRPVENTS